LQQDYSQVYVACISI